MEEDAAVPAIPALQPVANDNLENQVLQLNGDIGNAADATADDLDASARDYDSRKRSREEGTTAEDVLNAQIRYVTVQGALGRQMYPLADSSANAVMAQLQPQLNALLEGQARLFAQVANERGLRHNVRLEQLDLGWHRPRKEIPGRGLSLPYPAAPAHPPLRPAVEVGEVPPGCPGSWEAVEAMTHADISNLAVDYNTTFGIVPGMTVPARHARLQAWLMGAYMG